jgi:hypothetical protein
MAKVDLKSAYRHVPIHPECYTNMGLRWVFGNDLSPTYMYDCRLPFGASRSCKIFQSVTESLCRMLNRAGYNYTVYIDDFLIVEDSYDLCQNAVMYLLVLIRKLGLQTNWAKIEGPSTNLSFLGIHMDCVSRTLTLPPVKLLEVKKLVSVWSVKTKVTKKELQRFVGKLNWCCKVVHGGRTFIRNLINLMVKLRSSHHRVRLTSAAKSDIQWWVTGLDNFHGTTQFNCDIPLPSYQFATDACLTGEGGHFGTDWFHVNWSIDVPEKVSSHINVLELKTIHIAAEKWGHNWRGNHILVRTDNTATLAAINKGSSRNLEMLEIVKQIFWLSIKHRFRLSTFFVPGKINILADILSRLNEVDKAMAGLQFLSQSDSEVKCVGHMSESTFVCLQETWDRMLSDY